MKKRVLLFSISKHTGHFRAAKSIEAALNIVDPTCEILSIDAMQFFHPVASQVIDKMYYYSIKKAPFLWGGIYDSKSVKRTLSPIQKMIHHSNYAKLSKLVNQFNPHVVVCTQAFPCGLVAHLKRKTGMHIPLMGVVTDFWPHRFWFYKEVDSYTIASSWAKKRFKEFGIPEDKIHVAGIPIHPNFSKSLNHDRIYKELGLDPQCRTVMIMGGGSGLGPIESVVKYFDQSDLDCQFVVICGNNEKLYESLKIIHFKSRVKILGYCDEVYKIMSIADYVVSKAGGITTAEVMAKRKLLVSLPSIPGQEKFNLKYLLRNGLALRAKKADQVVTKLAALMHDEKRQASMIKRIQEVSKPESSLEIAKMALKLGDDYKHSIFTTDK